MDLSEVGQRAASVVVIVIFFWFVFSSMGHNKLKDWIKDFFGGNDDDN